MAVKILVVDDSATALVAVSEALAGAGFEVTTAGGGGEGLVAFAELEPDLVILDTRMPGLDGMEVCRRLRAQEKGRDVPILFLTEEEGVETQWEAIQAEGDDLILKQALPRELLIRVRSLLRLRHLQGALKVEREALQASNRQKDLLTRFIAHDLKSPLQAILFATEFLEEAAQVGGDWGPETAMIKEAGRAMVRTAQDLLDVGHSESGDLVPRLESLDLAVLGQHCQREIQAQMRRRKQTLNVDIPPGLTWVGDYDMLLRTLLHLLWNASKYAPSGGSIDLVIQARGDRLLVRVQDLGPGIPDAMKERILDPLARQDRGGGASRINSGLGLAFCRVAAQAHRGRIWIEDNLPRGTAVCLELPTSK